jgi:hypothetical protein
LTPTAISNVYPIETVGKFSTFLHDLLGMQQIVNAGLQYLASPRKPVGGSRDSASEQEDFSYDDTYSETPPPTDNMSILQSALEHQEAALQPSIRMSDASLYKAFCLEAGIQGTTEGFFVWQEHQTSGPKKSVSLLSPVLLTDTPANNTGKIHVTRLANAGVLSTVFVSEKMSAGFNKAAFTAATLYDTYNHIRHGAGMGIISLDTIWSFISVSGITPTMCNEVVLAQYNELVLDHPDPDRPMKALLRVLEVTMGASTVRSLRSMVLCINEADDTRGYGASFRLLCLLHVVHRLVQDALHNPRLTLIVHPFRQLIADEISSLTLISEYFETAKVSRQRVKDAKQEVEFGKINARLDKMAHTSSQHNSTKPSSLGSGRTVTQEHTVQPVKTSKQEVCLPHARSPLLCSSPCPHGRLHSWPVTMPAYTKDRLLAKAAKLDLPTSGKSNSGSVASSHKTQTTPRKPRADSPSSVESAVSSISKTEAPV